jgi:hypothetical protein
MAGYVWNGTEWMDRNAFYEWKASQVTSSDFPCPTVKPDIQEYRSPIDGRLITSNRQRRDEMRAHGCIPWEPGVNQSAKMHPRDPNWSQKHQRPMVNGKVV